MFFYEWVVYVDDFMFIYRCATQQYYDDRENKTCALVVLNLNILYKKLAAACDVVRDQCPHVLQ